MTSTIEPVPMLLTCPSCGKRHVDAGEFATKAHHTHACQHCGMVWRPALVATVGVQFLPGFRDEAKSRRNTRAPLRALVIECLRDYPNHPKDAADIARGIDRSVESVREALSKLIASGEAFRVERGLYVLKYEGGT